MYLLIWKFESNRCTIHEIKKIALDSLSLRTFSNRLCEEIQRFLSFYFVVRWFGLLQVLLIENITLI